MPRFRDLGDDAGSHEIPFYSSHGAPPERLDVPDDGQLLGRGGGGVVERGPDRHLPREVAWKSAAANDVRLRLRIATEARALAALEHPNIVPIYDQDVGPGGGLRLALRIIRGDTLESVIARTPSLDGRLRLLRDMLKAVEAVAWAHHRGWLHRDLKPANVMIGQFGEVQVIDWGLARREAEPPDPTLDPPGAPIGTWTTMSPEQARGELVSFESDVYSLGATLFWLIAGRSPQDEDNETARAALRRGQRARLLDLCPDAPLALAAIVERAMAPDPALRYPDAGALALDLSAFIDGRRVAAHSYGASERLVLFVRRWRLPLGAALAALIAVLVVGAVAFDRLADKQARVESAHQRALSAVAERDREAMRLLALEAQRALTDDARPEAELAAARSLAVRENPEARGVLAAFGRAPRPSHALRVHTGGCQFGDADSTGSVFVCGRSDSLALYDGPRLRWRQAGAFKAAALTDGGAAVAVQTFVKSIRILDAQDGRTLRTLADPTHLGRVRPGPGARFAVFDDRFRIITVDADGVHAWAPCHGMTNQASDFAPMGRRVALCADGTLVVGDGAGERRVATPLQSHLREYLTLAIVDDAHVLVATTRGTLHLVDTRDGTLITSRGSSPPRIIRSIAVSERGDRAIMEADGRGPTVIETLTLAPIGSLPRTEHPLRWLAGTGRFATRGATLTTWEIESGPGYRVSGLGSISALQASPTHLAIARNQGVSVLDLQSGARLLDEDWGRGVTKVVVPRGAELLVGIAEEGESIRDDTLIAEAFVLTQLAPTRRLHALPGERFVRTLTMPGLDLWWARDDTLRLSPAHHNDLAVHASWAVALESRPSRFSVYALDRAPVSLATCDDPEALAVAIGPGGDEGTTVYTLHASAVVEWSHSECRITNVLWPPHGELRQIAVTPDGAWIAAGSRAGDLFVWRRDGTLMSSAVLHDDAITALSPDPNGRWFITGTWAGDIRFTDITTLAAPREALVADVLGAW